MSSRMARENARSFLARQIRPRRCLDTRNLREFRQEADNSHLCRVNADLRRRDHLTYQWSAAMLHLVFK
jgi:hypothetical protein